jgi:hypothetical protein
MKPPPLEIRIEQDPYYFLIELREVLTEAGFKVEGKYIQGLDRLIDLSRVAANQMTVLPSGSSFSVTYADMCWDHEEDD